MRTRSEVRREKEQRGLPEDDPFGLPPPRQPDPPPPGDEPFDQPEQPTVLKAPEKPKPRAAAEPPEEIRRIIETVFEVDHESTWKRCHKLLREHESMRSYDARALLREVDDRCREAHKLYCALKLELERYEGDVEATRAAMRSEAADVLEGEKAEGTRKKAISEADIRAKMVELHPDECRTADVELRRFKLAVEHAEHLVGVLRQKSRSLQVEVGKGVYAGADD